jgi:hypothetical protein
MPIGVFTGIAIAVVLAGATKIEPLEDAEDADLRGDYLLELRLLKPLAQQGDLRAQKLLGDNVRFWPRCGS